MIIIYNNIYEYKKLDSVEMRSVMLSMKAARAASVCLSFLVVAGCSKTIGPNADDASLRGDVSLTTLFDGGPKVYKSVVDGRSLEPNESYYMSEGVLIIRGDVPPKTTVKVGMGRIEVTGNVNSEAKVKADMPELRHTENYTKPEYNAVFRMDVPVRHKRIVRDGLMFDDPTPGVRVGGYVESNASLSSNAGVFAQCASPDAKFATDWDRPIMVENSDCYSYSMN